MFPYHFTQRRLFEVIAEQRQPPIFVGRRRIANIAAANGVEIRDVIVVAEGAVDPAFESLAILFTINHPPAAIFDADCAPHDALFVGKPVPHMIARLGDLFVLGRRKIEPMHAWVIIGRRLHRDEDICARRIDIDDVVPRKPHLPKRQPREFARRQIKHRKARQIDRLTVESAGLAETEQQPPRPGPSEKAQGLLHRQREILHLGLAVPRDRDNDEQRLAPGYRTRRIMLAIGRELGLFHKGFGGEVGGPRFGERRAAGLRCGGCGCGRWRLTLRCAICRYGNPGERRHRQRRNTAPQPLNHAATPSFFLALDSACYGSAKDIPNLNQRGERINDVATSLEDVRDCPVGWLRGPRLGGCRTCVALQD